MRVRNDDVMSTIIYNGRVCGTFPPEKVYVMYGTSYYHPLFIELYILLHTYPHLNLEEDILYCIYNRNTVCMYMVTHTARVWTNRERLPILHVVS